ncbi:MAG: hypothetical protein R3311_20865 [Oceanisphaera sp.]|nr:hypothetical protein [Oceanisphaera sp.]
MFSYLELVELPNGDIILQRTEGEGEPLVTIRFSAESREYMVESPMEVARAMIQAGIQAAAEQGGAEMEIEDEDVAFDELAPDPKTLH